MIPPLQPLVGATGETPPLSQDAGKVPPIALNQNRDAIEKKNKKNYKKKLVTVAEIA